MARHNVRLRQLAVVAATIANLVGARFPADAEDRIAPSEKVAIVNGVDITAKELRHEMDRLARKNPMTPDGSRPDVDRQLRTRALDNLIDRELLYQESLEKGISIPPADVEREIEGLRRSLVSPVELDKALDDFKYSADTIKREIEKGMAVRRLLLSRLAGRTVPSEQEIEEYYAHNRPQFVVPEQIRLSHILVRIEPRWQTEKIEAARVRIRGIHLRVLEGNDFAAVARESLDCPSGKAGGDIGWFSRGRLAPAVEQVVFSLPVGGAGSIVEDSFGFHLMKVAGRRARRTVLLEEGRAKIVDYLVQEKVRAEAVSLARSLRTKADIQVYPNDGT